MEPSGRKTFVWYFSDGGKTRVLTLGRYGEGEGRLTLAKARQKLQTTKERRSDGGSVGAPADAPEYWDYLEHGRWINIQIMERFKAEGIDFAFPTQTLHLAGDDKRPLTVGQRWVAEEEDVSHGAMLAHAATLGAQTVLTKQVPASESVQPAPAKTAVFRSDTDGKPTGAAVEDNLSDGNEGGETGAAEDEAAAAARHGGPSEGA